MKRIVEISIPKPCHQQWQTFTQTSNGGFCASCQKDVIDFSRWSDERLKAYLTTDRSNVCGRFREDQLKVYSFGGETKSKSWWISVLLSLVVVLSSREALAQRHKCKQTTEQVNNNEALIGKIKLDPVDTMRISGTVTDGGETMPGVNVVRKGTAQGTVTNAEGRYELEIVSPANSETLVFTFIGYSSTEVCIAAQSQVSTSVCMKSDLMVLGGMEYAANRTISPRRWWWNFKYLVRSKLRN